MTVAQIAFWETMDAKVLIAKQAESLGWKVTSVGFLEGIDPVDGEERSLPYSDSLDRIHYALMKGWKQISVRTMTGVSPVNVIRPLPVPGHAVALPHKHCPNCFGQISVELNGQEYCGLCSVPGPDTKMRMCHMDICGSS